jgi:hypothetical protein
MQSRVGQGVNDLFVLQDARDRTIGQRVVPKEYYPVVKNDCLNQSVEILETREIEALTRGNRLAIQELVVSDQYPRMTFGIHVIWAVDEN